MVLKSNFNLGDLMAKIPIDVYSNEIEIKKSRFIGYGFPIDSPEDAREKLKSLRIKYPDSRHICYGFVWGKNSTHMGMSDDGEPSGTAGRPMLEVVKGSGYENILVAAVRFFGGIKLGTGGLVKAYTEITQLVVKNIKVEEFFEKDKFTLSVPYQLYDSVKRTIVESQGKIIVESFLTNIDIIIELPCSEEDVFRENITNISKGQLIVTKL